MIRTRLTGTRVGIATRPAPFQLLRQALDDAKEYMQGKRTLESLSGQALDCVKMELKQTIFRAFTIRHTGDRALHAVCYEAVKLCHRQIHRCNALQGA